MAQIFRAANLAREFEAADLRVLTGIELGMRRFEFVPLNQISFYARIDRPETQYRLDKLHKNGILQRNSALGYVGYQLNSEAYDVLSLHTLVEQNVIIGVGDALGRGKESDVFYAQLPDHSEAVMKIHRIGQTSFRKVRKLRSYVQNRRHISWLYINRLSAESEFKALQRLVPLQLNTPSPLGQNRHIVIMSLIDGKELSLLTHLDHPEAIMDEILTQVERIFVEAKMIHCDLCEFNILITPEDKVRIIDWPQWEDTSHPNAISYMARDLHNIQTYFTKYYNLTFDLDDILDRLFGKGHPEYILD